MSFTAMTGRRTGTGILTDILWGSEMLFQYPTVFSIHNLKFQGRFSLPAVIDITGLPEQIFSSDKLESYGKPIT